MQHPWLEKYPINKDSQYLIIGSHPPMPYCGKFDYFYGNRYDFWRFIHKTYPDETNIIDSCCTQEDNVRSFLSKYIISITDIVAEISGKPFNTDKETKVISHNKCLKSQIDSGSIKTIYFTSFAGKNNALYIIIKLIKQNYNKLEILDLKFWINSGFEIALEKTKFTLQFLLSLFTSFRGGKVRSIPFTN